MPVSTTHPDYDKYISRWQIVRDCVEGSSAVKKRGKIYLPMPNPEDQSKENNSRYDDYLLRANFVNFTGSTKEGMLGMVFRKDMTVELPASIEYIIENANGAGLSIQQLTQDITGDALETGRYGILVDYPPAPPGLTQSEVMALNLQANLLPYTAENIIYWDTMTVGGVVKLSSLVLREPTKKYNDDGFGFKEVIYHRHLFLKDGVYVQNLYDEDDELLFDAEGVSDITPRNSKGVTWKEIPFVFIGAQNNDTTIDKAPLYDIAEVNVAHYRNSADFEESCYMVGQPTPVISGLTQSWVDTNMKDGVYLGSRRSITLPEGGAASLLQANENTMPSNGMEIKEQQIIKIGARIIQDAGGNETAEAAKIRFAGQNSKLGLIVENVEKGLQTAIKYLFEFMGNSGDFKIEINKEFYERTLDAQQAMALIQFADRGDIGQSQVRDMLRRSGWTDATDEDLDKSVEESGPPLVDETINVG